jgi:hypothetical protein
MHLDGPGSRAPPKCHDRDDHNHDCTDQVWQFRAWLRLGTPLDPQIIQ